MKKRTRVYRVAAMAVLCLTVLSSCTSSGGVWLGEGEANGKAYTFGTPTETEMLQALAKAYSEKDTETLFSYYADDFVDEKSRKDLSEWLESMESITMTPYKVIPLHQKDGDFKQVLAWSKEERIAKNGSYEKLDLMEQFVLNEEGKVRRFRQWKAIDSANFGYASGGKFYGRKLNDNRGRPFVFSNRNETQIIEDFVAAYNKMDVSGMMEAFADEFEVNDYQGKKAKFKKADLNKFFSSLKSVQWDLISIVPIKISNTDAASGVIVYGHEKRVSKKGKVWDKDLMEIYYFNLEGKISSMVQFAKP